MSGKSKIDIFKNMKKEELHEEIRKYTTPYRIYQRLIAMKLISEGNTLKKTGEILGVSYQTINRWAHNCESKGLEGLIPNFGGGRPSFLTNKQKKILDQIIEETPNLTMKDVQKIVFDKFGVEYSLKQIGVITKSMGYNYSKAYPKFSKTPENAEEILKKN